MLPVAHIVALGARTGVGLRPETAAAAIRAGISRVGEHPYLVDIHGEPLRVAHDPRLDPELPHLDRLVALAEYCLADLAARVSFHPSVSIPLLLSLPEHRPGFTAANEQELERRLGQARMGVRLRSVRTVARGHAGGLHAFHLAAQLVSTLPEGMCIVGGVESYLAPETLTWLSEHRQLVEPGTRGGFFPGEGACFALVVSHAVRRQLRLPSLAAIRSSATAQEPRCLKPRGELDNLGHGLSAAVVRACRTMGGAAGPIDDVYCDINGERYRAEEWGLAILRTSPWFRDAADYTAPAAQWGDLGAATGTALAMLAVAAWQRGYARGPLAMLFAGSESGLRGVVILEHDSQP